MSNSQPSKTAKSTEPARPAAGPRSSTAAVDEPLDSPRQLSTFESAIRHFHARKFKEARELFQHATQGPQRDIAQRAGLHIRMCDRRLQEVAVSPASPEDHYTYGVALINTRNLAAAQEHLAQGLAAVPDADHIHYAMALCRALSGDLAGAYEHLQRAIELEPRNRIAARQDADFAPFVNQPPLDALLHPERKNW